MVKNCAEAPAVPSASREPSQARYDETPARDLIVAGNLGRRPALDFTRALRSAQAALTRVGGSNAPAGARDFRTRSDDRTGNETVRLTKSVMKGNWEGNYFLGQLLI
jgi:hypothetical protein